MWKNCFDNTKVEIDALSLKRFWFCPSVLSSWIIRTIRSLTQIRKNILITDMRSTLHQVSFNHNCKIYVTTNEHLALKAMCECELDALCWQRSVSIKSLAIRNTDELVMGSSVPWCLWRVKVGLCGPLQYMGLWLL